MEGNNILTEELMIRHEVANARIFHSFLSSFSNSKTSLTDPFLVIFCGLSEVFSKRDCCDFSLVDSYLMATWLNPTLRFNAVFLELSIIEGLLKPVEKLMLEDKATNRP